MLKKIVSFILFVFLVFLCSVMAQKKILVYTKNGDGYVHDNIAASVEAIKKLGPENHFEVDVSDDPAVFTEENLKQ